MLRVAATRKETHTFVDYAGGRSRFSQLALWQQLRKEFLVTLVENFDELSPRDLVWYASYARDPDFKPEQWKSLADRASKRWGVAMEQAKEAKIAFDADENRDTHRAWNQANSRESLLHQFMVTALRSSGKMERVTEHLRERLGLACLLYTSPSPRDQRGSRMPSSA